MFIQRSTNAKLLVIGEALDCTKIETDVFLGKSWKEIKAYALIIYWKTKEIEAIITVILDNKQDFFLILDLYMVKLLILNSLQSKITANNYE